MTNWKVGATAVLWLIFLIPDFYVNSGMGKPWITIFAKIQAPVQCFLRPAVWIPGLRNLHSHSETWTFNSDSHQDNLKSVLDAVTTVIEKDTSRAYWQIRPTVFQESKSFLRVFAFTRSEWLDVIEITFEGKEAKVWAFSSGFLPLSIPLACIINVPLFWIPFLDMDFNKKRCDKITAELGSTVQRS